MDAAADLSPAPRPKIRIGDVLGRGLRATFADLPAYLSVTFAAGSLAYLLAVLLYGVEIFEIMAATNAEDSPFRREEAVLTLVGMVTNTFAQIVIIRHLAARLSGQPIGLGAALKGAGSLFWPLIIANTLFWIGMVVGTVLLVAPGLIFLACYAVIGPAVVLEQAGIIGSFTRSRYLTSGNRWRILGLFLLLIAMVSGLSIVIGLPIGLIAVYAADGGLSTGLALAVIDVLISSFVMVLATCILTVLFRDLVFFRDGETPAEVGGTFD